jgi:3-oxoacyl-[acyl-carrier protein] reductase
MYGIRLSGAFSGQQGRRHSRRTGRQPRCLDSMTSDSQQTIVVTGGSRGIGQAICAAFARPKTTVYYNYRRPEETGEETAARIIEAGGLPRGMQINVAAEHEVALFFKTILAETERIDVLVNNAAVTRDNLLIRMKAKDWQEVMNVNLGGVFYCTREAAKAMIRQRCGSIINIASIAGVAGNAGQANYAAAKAGMIGFTKSMARELASRHITVNAIAPGYIETDMTAHLTDAAKSEIISQIPLARPGSPADIAGVAVFLASHAARYITGQVIHVNGGMYM